MLAIVGREGRSPLFGAPPPAPPVDDPGGALARRYLQRARADHAAAVPRTGRCSRCRTRSGCGTRAGELAHVGDRWVLAEDAGARGARAAAARGCCRTSTRWRARRTARCSCPTRRCASGSGAGSAARVWCSLDGEVAGLWRPRKKGKRLVVELEPLRKLTAAERDALAAEAERIAPFRGAETAELA